MSNELETTWWQLLLSLALVYYRASWGRCSLCPSFLLFLCILFCLLLFTSCFPFLFPNAINTGIGIDHWHWNTLGKNFNMLLICVVRLYNLNVFFNLTESQLYCLWNGSGLSILDLLLPERIYLLHEALITQGAGKPLRSKSDTWNVKATVPALLLWTKRTSGLRFAVIRDLDQLWAVIYWGAAFSLCLSMSMLPWDI
jgi:hypothetical protein